MDLSSAVKCLGIVGVIMSILCSVIITVYVYISLDTLGNEGNSLGIYTGATIGLLLSLGCLTFSIILLGSSNGSQDIIGGGKFGVKRMIKIGSFIIGMLQTLGAALATVVCIVFLSVLIGDNSFNHSNSSIPLAIPLLIIGVFSIISSMFLVFSSLLLHGLRTNSPGKIEAWIIFQFVLCGLTVGAGLISLGFYVTIYRVVNLAIGCLFYMYFTGMVIVHYNILMEDTNVNLGMIKSLDSANSRTEEQTSTNMGIHSSIRPEMFKPERRTTVFFFIGHIFNASHHCTRHVAKQA